MATASFAAAETRGETACPRCATYLENQKIYVITEACETGAEPLREKISAIEDLMKERAALHSPRFPIVLRRSGLAKLAFACGLIQPNVFA